MKGGLKQPLQTDRDALLKKALEFPSNPLSRDDVLALGDLQSQSPERLCAVWVKFFHNVLALPGGEAAIVVRYFLGS